MATHKSPKITAIEVWKDTQLNHDTKGSKKRMCHVLFLF